MPRIFKLQLIQSISRPNHYIYIFFKIRELPSDPSAVIPFAPRLSLRPEIDLIHPQYKSAPVDKSRKIPIFTSASDCWL